MSIVVRNLSKIYGEQAAISNLSFTIDKGEIVGFLGPNGAGKSTTMKILSCFIPPTKGEAEVAGYNVWDDRLMLRTKIGYLAEHNPLYKDMYVKEYLSFVARIHKVSDRTSAISRMIDLTGLTKEQHKPIRALSKGYRQRVGLAQAMIHDPEVLILDEPTSGLDPNQLVEIRQLILEFGRDKTVLFSSHIMQQVQAICDRVIILNQGVKVADEPIHALTSRVEEHTRCRIGFTSQLTQSQILSIPKVVHAEQKSKFWVVGFSTKEDPRPIVFQWAVQNRLTLVHLEQLETTLETVFQQLTK